MRPTIRPERIVQEIDGLLQQAAASAIFIDGCHIKFRAGAFRAVWSWNILAPFGWGSISVKEESDAVTVTYQLSTLQMLVGATLMVTWLGLFVFSAPNLNTAEAMTIMCVFWLWLFGANYLIAVIRFPAWLKNGLKHFSDEYDGGAASTGE